MTLFHPGYRIQGSRRHTITDPGSATLQWPNLLLLIRFRIKNILLDPLDHDSGSFEIRNTYFWWNVLNKNFCFRWTRSPLKRRLRRRRVWRRGDSIKWRDSSGKRTYVLKILQIWVKKKGNNEQHEKTKINWINNVLSMMKKEVKKFHSFFLFW